MTTLSKEEEALRDEMSADLRAAKKAMRAAIAKSRDMMAIQEKAGRVKAYAEAYSFFAALQKAEGEIHTAHAVGTMALANSFDDTASSGPVVYFGGGGR